MPGWSDGLPRQPTAGGHLAVRQVVAEAGRLSCMCPAPWRIQGKHPGFKALTAWARETLHPSLSMLSLKTNNLFEITFTSPEGRIHALTQTYLICETTTISFSSWRPHFDSKTPQTKDRLDFPIWVQVADLCHVLREDNFLHIIAAHIGHVVAMDTSEAYREMIANVSKSNNDSKAFKINHLV